MTNISNAAAALGRKGGLARTDEKTQASRENGARGGRPKKFKSYAEAAEFAKNEGRDVNGILGSGKRFRATAKGVIESDSK